jgi:hypothetical protein
MMKQLLISIFVLFLFCSCTRTGQIERAIGNKIDACKPDVPCIIKIRDLTDFQWDEMHVFSYGSNLEEIQKTLRTDFPHYVEFKRRIIFLNEGKIVHWENEPTNIEGMIDGQVVFIGMQNEPSQLSFTSNNAVFAATKYGTGYGVAYSLKQIE